MTFCLAAKVHDGLVGIADTRLTTGSECITARKVSVHTHGQHSLFLMTSGLRSVRDKVVTYFEDVLESSDTQFDLLYKALNPLAPHLPPTPPQDRQTPPPPKLQFTLFPPL